MRLQVASMLVWATSFGFEASAQQTSSTATIQQPLSAVLPSCAETCMMSAIAQSTCSLTDNACICSNTNLTAAISGCLVQTCTVIEMLQAQNYSKVSCGAPVRARPEAPMIVAYTLFAASCVAVSTRLVSRSPWMNGKWNFGWDDWITFSCLIVLIVTAIFSWFLDTAGLGCDIWTLTPSQITHLLQYFYIEEITYSWVVCFTKVAMSFFYRRIFLPDSASKTCRWGCNTLLITSLMFWLAQTLSIVFLCQPISYSWTSWDGEHIGICGDRGAQAYINGTINIVLDLFTFALPIPKLYKLNMTFKKKFLTVGMFLTGFFITACSLVRIEQVAQYSNTQNPTYDYVGLSNWSLAEMHASVIVICMPSMAKLFQRCYVEMTHLSASTSGLHRGNSTRRLAPAPETFEATETKKRGPLSRMIYSLGDMTNDVRSNVSTFAKFVASSSQKSIYSGTENRVEEATIDHSIPEYADYMKYYAHYGMQSNCPQASLEMKHIV